MIPDGLPAQLCTALTTLTSLRIVGGECSRLPPEISCLQGLQVLALDSMHAPPAIPPAISALTSVTNLQLAVRPVCRGARPVLSRAGGAGGLAGAHAALDPPCSALPSHPPAHQNLGMTGALPRWVLHMPVRRLWLAGNALESLLPEGGARAERVRRLRSGAGWKLAMLRQLSCSATPLACAAHPHPPPFRR